MRIEVDNHKLLYHPERVAEWIQKEDCYPIYVEIGPVSSCNHRCIFCALDYLERAREFIDTDIMVSTLEEISENGVKSVMFAGEGEPLMHKDIGLFTKKAKKAGLDVSITTNGVLFNEKKREKCLPNLSWIRFSVDSGSPENYAIIHGTKKGDYNRVIRNIEESVKFRDKNNLETTIGVQFLMIPQNVDEATKLAERLSEIGADNLQVKPYSHHPHSINNLCLNPEVYNKLEEELTKYSNDKFKVLFRKATIERIDEGITYPKCYGLPFFALIDAKGNIIPCNLFHELHEFSYGNLYENTFSQIWKSEKRKQVLEKIRGRGIEDCRNGCRLDAVNKYLNRLKNPHPHDSFI